MKTNLNLKYLLLIFLFAHFSESVISQIRESKCATMEVLKQNIAKDASILQRMQMLEEFTRKYIADEKSNKNAQAVITIPVVFHVIHMGEPVGTGTNISDAQLLSQIDELNEDFRNMNSDALPPSHPFFPVTADCEIEFCLATRDPLGNTTSGIERFNYFGPQSIPNFEVNIKQQTIWNRDNYLNFWTCEFDSTYYPDLLGYSQYPGGNPLTDGIVVRYYAVGRVGNVIQPFHLGRVAAHEVGHWLNLRHIWGDDFCGEDSVADTEPAVQANTGCFTFPFNDYNSCGSGPNGEMFMNYMDYTDDPCVVMLTAGQKSRMWAALNGARTSLLTSNGCQWVGINESYQTAGKIFISPNPVANHLSIHNTKAIHEVEIFNTLGEKVYDNAEPSGSNAETINVSKLSSGIYFVRVRTSDGMMAGKFVKE